MQGFNMGRYVPPDLEGTTSFNTASGKGHALGARARKLKSEGILIVRFECPFAIWCTTCNPEQIIGQGVRFNAEKKKVGMYYTTPIWQFRFKHSVCGGWVEVRTDPEKTRYVVGEGGKKRDFGEEDGNNVTGPVRPEELEDGFGKLEKKVEDKERAKGEKGRLLELERRSELDWEDPYEQSRRLRREFRVGRKVRKEEALRGEALKDRLSLGIELLEEREEDGARARFIEFGDDAEKPQERKPMFVPDREPPKPIPAKEGGKRGKKVTAAELAAQKKIKLGQQLSGNTKAALDPFLQSEDVWRPSLKRKKVQEGAGIATDAAKSVALVDYDSD